MMTDRSSPDIALPADEEALANFMYSIRSYDEAEAKAKLLWPMLSGAARAPNREKVAAFLLARDEEYSATPHLLAWADKLIQEKKDAVHSGDCTGESHTCHRCTADRALADADKVIALAGDVAQCERQPTHEMVLAGARSIGNTIRQENHMERARDCWRAMNAAARGVVEPVPQGSTISSTNGNTP